MTHWILLLSLVLATPAPVLCAEAEPEAKAAVPLLPGMGSHHHPVTSRSPLAQRYFDQGLVLAFAFNHREAARSFREAQRLDPECAMCFWGEALVLGPNINAPMDPKDNPAAYAAVQKALALKDQATPPERAYIEALAARYAEEAPADRSSLELAYAEAMSAVAARYPADADAAALYAEALMDTTPWDYWLKDEQPKPVTRTMLATLDDVLAKHPEHPLANHLYIHAVEKVRPQLGIAAADRLRNLVPGSGHLQHMPAHIYVRVGRYYDAVAVNEKAVAVDAAYLAAGGAEGIYPISYVPHNHHFLAFAASMAGMSQRAIAAARHMAAHQDQTLMRQPGHGTIQHYWIMPLYALVRFGHWDEILSEPEPAGDLPYPRGVWHYARGLALSSKGRLRAAQAELEALGDLAENRDLEGLRIWETTKTADLLRIANGVLAGEIAHAGGDDTGAIAQLRRAVEMEDALTYVEPPDWFTPARHNLGAVLLAAGRPAEAEQVYRDDLKSYPDNGWSLSGLARSLRDQGREKDAQRAEERFRAAWAHADIKLGSSVE